jgi:hypothetical protein
MTTYTCGCALEPADRTQRCQRHAYGACHLLADATASQCPPCLRARWLSVSIAPSATPTRGRKP